MSAATTLTLGGPTNASGATFAMGGTSSHAVTLALGSGGPGFTSNAGNFELTYASPLALSSAFVNSGTFGIHLNTAVTVEGGFTNSGTLDVDNVDSDLAEEFDGGSSLKITGTLTNNGAVQVGNVALSAATTMTLGGLTNAASTDSFSVNRTSSNAVTLAFSRTGSGFTSNAGNFELTYASTLTLSSAFVNSGTFGIHLNTAVTVEGGFTNSGTLDVDNVDSDLAEEFDGGSSLKITGTLTNNGAVQVGNVALSAATTMTLGGLTNANGASFAVNGSSSNAATVTVNGSASNAGTLNVGAYSIFDVTNGGDFTQTGETTNVSGSFSITAGAPSRRPAERRLSAPAGLSRPKPST